MVTVEGSDAFSGEILEEHIVVEAEVVGDGLLSEAGEEHIHLYPVELHLYHRHEGVRHRMKVRYLTTNDVVKNGVEFG